MKKALVNVVFIVIILFQCLFLVYWGMKKEGFFVDELYTAGLANDTSGQAFFNAKEDYLNQWHDAGYAIDSLSVGEDDTMMVSLTAVYNNQAKDVHPPLYYLLFNIASHFVIGHYSKWLGICLNMIFFVIAQGFLYIISKKVIKDNWLSLVPLAVYGFSVGAINSVLLSRMYMMLTMMGLIFLTLLLHYIDIVLFRQFKDDVTKQRCVFANLIGVYVVSCLGMLVQYYFIIFVFFACVSTCTVLLINKKVKAFWGYVIAVVLGILNAVAIFIPMINHIFYGGRGKESVHNLSNSNFITMFCMMFGEMNKQVFAGGLLVIVCVILLILIINMIKQKNKMLAIVEKDTFVYSIIMIVTAMGYFVTVCKILVFSHWRYLVMVYPIIVVITVTAIIMMIKSFQDKLRNIMLSVACLLLVLLSLLTPLVEKPDFLFVGYQGLYKEFAKNNTVPCFYATCGDYSVTYHLDLLSHICMFYAYIPDESCNIPDEMRNYAARNDEFYLLADPAFYNDSLQVQELTEELGYSKWELLYDFVQDSYASYAKIYKLEK